MPQYQHYVPQFILRRYTDYVKPERAVYDNKQGYDRAVSRAKKQARVNILDFGDGFDKGRLERRLCSKTFGLPDMYDEEIEPALSALERDASEVIKVIEGDFLCGKKATVIGGRVRISCAGSFS